MRILDQLGAEGIVGGKRGTPIAKVVALGGCADASGLIGSLKGSINVKGDIFSTGVKWNAES